MITEGWETSPREHEITVDYDVAIPVSAGFNLRADIFRPAGSGKFPALFMISPYDRKQQSFEMMPLGFPGRDRGSLEVGDFNFYVRRGYAFVIVNMRGTFGSDGEFDNLHPAEESIRDIADAITWTAEQSWCDGNVAMNGVSYFSVVQKRAAVLKPDGLKAIFAMYGWSDGYRDALYRGGILAHRFRTYWLKAYAHVFRFSNSVRRELGEQGYKDAIAAALADDEIAAVPDLAEALRNPDEGANPLINEIILKPLYDDYYRERDVNWANSDGIAGYFGADWGNFGLHLAGDMRAYKEWLGPKKLTVGPPIYLDRPLYQYAYESLRWFDHWLKGRDTGLMDEPAVKVYIVGADEWKMADRWPIPGTQWTPFYLHSNGLLSEHEYWPNEGHTTYEDSPFARGSATFTTPAIVEKTEVCGPIALKLYGSTTDTEVLWFVSLWHVDAAGQSSLLTRGWLRGSQRELDPEKTTRWQPYHTHTKREPLDPGEIYEFDIEIRPYGILLKPGEKLAVRISSGDNEKPANFLHGIGLGSLNRTKSSHVTIHHNASYPSHLLLPITRGNVIGTFLSGGEMVSPWD